MTEPIDDVTELLLLDEPPDEPGEPAGPNTSRPAPPQRPGRRCAGLTGQCHAPATLRVSWLTLGRWRRRRARMCQPCVGVLRQQVTVYDVQTRPDRRAARHAAQAAARAAGQREATA